jgi:serine/threonine protein kinase
VKVLELLSDSKIVHRDLSPSNIMLAYPPQIKSVEDKRKFISDLMSYDENCSIDLDKMINPIIIDFGIAKEMKNSLLTLSKDAGFIYVNLFFVILYI